MITITDLLNKIKWDEREDPKDYILVYYDRVEDALKDLPLTQVEVEEGFMKTKVNGKQVSIPLHRIRQVKKQGKTIWKRQTTKELD